jgi:hypothetical protein
MPDDNRDLRIEDLGLTEVEMEEFAKGGRFLFGERRREQDQSCERPRRTP